MGGAKELLCDAKRHGTEVPSSVDGDHGLLRGTMDRTARHNTRAGSTAAQEYRCAGAQVGVWDEMQKANSSSARSLDKEQINAQSSRLARLSLERRRVARGRVAVGVGL